MGSRTLRVASTSSGESADEIVEIVEEGMRVNDITTALNTVKVFQE
jgi:hypothetical protein